MRIYNVMFSAGRGGIEQSCLDYCSVLSQLGHEVVAVLLPEAATRPDFEALVRCVTFPNMGEWDFFASWKMRAFFREQKPDILICHGNRAISLVRKAAPPCPVVGVTHNYSLDRFLGLDGVIAPTRDLAHMAELKGIPAERIWHVPHMIQVGGGFIKKARRGIPVIGSMGRLIEKKGFAVFIEALAWLKKEKAEFRAVLGGDGKDKAKLQRLAEKHGVSDALQFIGWVDDKKNFFERVDIFCLPSLHEPFGIVLLEAMAHKVPVISTDSEGPSEIISHGENGLLVPKNDAEALGRGLLAMIDDEVYCRELAGQAYDQLRQYYAYPVVGKRLEQVLQHIAGATQPVTAECA